MNINQLIERSPQLHDSLGDCFPLECSQLKRGDIVWEAGHYTRQSLFKNEKVEAVLLAWEPHAFSPIHDHPDQYGFMYILEGAIEEDTYLFENKKLVQQNSHVLQENTCQYIPLENNIHQIKNGTERSLSIHFYFPPKGYCYVYTPDGEIIKKILA